jgi:Holliday junction resolvasome RuvABC endonuclease subunit
MPRNHVDGGLLVGQPSEIVIGLDPSLTGFGMTALDPTSGRFDSWLYKSPQRGIERLMDIQSWLFEKFQLLVDAGFTIMDVAVEDTVVASHSATAMGELSAVVRMFCRNNLEGSAQYPMKVPPTSVKKFATNRGNAKKAEVLLAVYKKWGHEFTDDNLADSFVLAKIVASEPETQYESEVVAKLRDAKFRDPARV